MEGASLASPSYGEDRKCLISSHFPYTSPSPLLPSTCLLARRHPYPAGSGSASIRRTIVELALLTHHGAMVGDKNDDRVLHQPHGLYLFEKLAEPLVDETHVAGVERPDVLDFVWTHFLGCRRRRDQPRAAVITLHVHPIEAFRWVPKLMRRERLDVQIKVTNPVR